MKPQAVAILPARLAATRLPNKPLLYLANKPMIQHVYERALQAESLAGVLVATPDAEIAAAVHGFGGQVALTSPTHRTGTDRVAEAARSLPEDVSVVVNVQGDEPLIDPLLIDSVAELLRLRPEASMATAAHPIAGAPEFHNPNVVKVVTDAHGLALYFSRAPIPWWRDAPPDGQTRLAEPAPLRHIGLYAYRARFLRAFPTLAQAPFERTEALEQLRALWHGHRIAVHVAGCAPGPGVDTPEDLARVRALFGPPGT